MVNLILCPDTNFSPELTFYKTSCSEMIWENGEWIDTETYDLSDLVFILETPTKTKMTDYAVSDLGCSIVSERLKRLFDSAGICNIQYFKAQIIERKGADALDGFYVANIIGLEDCIDFEPSEMDVEIEENADPIIYAIENLVLKDFFCDKPLFRIKHFTRLILLYQDLKEKLIQSGVTGIKLIAPEKWDGVNGEK